MDIETMRGAVARGWCHEKNEKKVMDTDLAEAIAQEVMLLLLNEKKKKWVAIVNGEIDATRIIEAEEWQLARSLLWDISNQAGTFDVIEVDDVIKAAKELEKM